jgi:hypothetical protein
MNYEYKELIVEQLFGLIEGSAKTLESIISNNFKRKFKFSPDYIKVSSTDYFVTDDGIYKNSWVGTMTAIICIEGEEFSVTRDWYEEFEIDKKHPDFQNDWFFESDNCYSYIKCKEIVKSINPKEIAKKNINTYDSN